MDEQYFISPQIPIKMRNKKIDFGPIIALPVNAFGGYRQRGIGPPIQTIYKDMYSSNLRNPFQITHTMEEQSHAIPNNEL